GIMPDYFVPLDTTSSSKYFNQLFNANILREYAFTFAEQNKTQLLEKGYSSYLEKFEVNDAMLSRVVVMGVNEKITPRPNDLAKNKRLFQVYLKAEIARNVWDNQSFYPIINETNEVLQQAIKLFDRIPELNKSKM
ncbi:MAG: peptidase S41, partial [Cyclobacteriaceae bacterium]|nr:peptidase S41 [Cyclobacteriaceae bacterium]